MQPMNNKNNGGKRVSYFEEQVINNRNPNFFYSLDESALRGAVRRIVKEVYDNIIPQEYQIYFTNQKLLSACYNEARQNYDMYRVQSNALSCYINQYLPSGSYEPGTVPNVLNERSIAVNEHNRTKTKANIWKLLLDIFDAIIRGYDPYITFQPIRNIEPKTFKSL